MISYEAFAAASLRRAGHHMAALQAIVMEWIAAHGRRTDLIPWLEVTWVGPDEWQIIDTRDCAQKSEHLLTGLAARIYANCDRMQTSQSLARQFPDIAADDINAATATMVEDKLMLSLCGRLLSLAIMRIRPPELEVRDGRVTATTADAPTKLLCTV